MRRAILILLLLFTAACATAGGGRPPAEPADPALRPGFALFSTRCQRCHALPAPTKLTPDAWPSEVAGMSRKAGLSPDEVRQVTSYLVAASREGQRTN